MGRRARLSSPLLLVVTLLAGLQRDASAQQVSDNTLSSGPDSDSVCQRRSGGYYADLTSDCSSYTLCAPGGRPFHFACPPGTRFHQQYLVCDHEYRVDCPDSPRFFALNEAIGREQPAESAEPERDTGQERALRTRPVLADNRSGPPAPPPPPLLGPERPATGRSISSTPFSAPSQLAQSTRTQSQPAPARVLSPFSAQSPRAQSPFSASSTRAQSGSSSRPQSSRDQSGTSLRAQSPLRTQSPFSAPSPQVQSKQSQSSQVQSPRAQSLQAQPPSSAPSFQTESPRALPTTDAGQTLLELLRFSTRESSQRPAPATRARQAPAAVEPRSQPSDVSPAVPPGVPAILTQVAALGGSVPAPAILTRVAGLEPASEPVAPPRRPGLTQEAPLPRRTVLNASPGQRQAEAPIVTGTFFPARPETPPRQQHRGGFNRVQRLNNNLSSAPVRPGPARPGPALGAGRRARWPLPAAGRRRASLGGGGGWRTARRPAAGADPRCPRCLAALVTEWDNCFPCVSVLR